MHNEDLRVEIEKLKKTSLRVHGKLRRMVGI